MPRILLSWIGRNDIDAAKRQDPKSPGPVASVLSEEAFDHAVLLNNYAKSDIRGLLPWLEKCGAPEAELRQADRIKNPTDYNAIHEAEVAAFEWVTEQYGDEARIAVHLSSGTPQMQAVWLILTATRFPAVLYQSSRERGVERVAFPFDLSAEFVADAMRRSDARLEQVADRWETQHPAFDEIMQRSKPMQHVIARATKVAPHNVPVLIQGEPGTGKELFARAIHATSLRKGGFIEVNCAGIPEQLLESELFGHKKGAFTGATSDRRGHFEQAEGGTLFLDEIGELPLGSQAKLLRVLQEKTVTRVGESRARPVDARVIAATNRDLSRGMREGQFRDDLYQRLARAVLILPALRRRSGDLGPAIELAVQETNEELADQPGYVPKNLSAAARNLLLQHAWPGNVRELYNVIFRLLLWTHTPTVGVEAVREELQYTQPANADPILDRPLGDGFQLSAIIEEVARHYLARALEEGDQVKARAASLVGFPNPVTFKNWLEKYGVTAPRNGEGP